MKIIKIIRVSLILSFLLILPHYFFATNQDDISIFIRFYNKKIYYLNTVDDIKIKVTIINNSLSPFRFKMADKKILNLDFEVKTPTNIILEHADKFNIERDRVQYAYYKEIMLKPEEEYGFVVDIVDFIDLDRAGPFNVQCFFFQGLLTSPASKSLKSNILSLNIRPEVLSLDKKELIEEKTGRILKRQVLPPDEVVAFTIVARQRSKWERFFLYLDIEKLMLNNEYWRKRYNKSSEEERVKILDQYRGELKKERVDQEILVIPQEFEIIKTTYDKHKGNVEVIEKFQYRDYVEVKRYTYHLVRKDIYWMITNYEVVNLRTE